MTAPNMATSWQGETLEFVSKRIAGILLDARKVSIDWAFAWRALKIKVDRYSFFSDIFSKGDYLYDFLCASMGNPAFSKWVFF